MALILHRYSQVCAAFGAEAYFPVLMRFPKAKRCAQGDKN
jgi:hypothetical protein